MDQNESLKTAFETYNRCFSNDVVVSYSLAYDLFGMEYAHYANELYLRNLDEVFRVLRFIYETSVFPNVHFGATSDELQLQLANELNKLRCYEILLLRGIFKYDKQSIEIKERLQNRATFAEPYRNFYDWFLNLKHMVLKNLTQVQVQVMCHFLAVEEDVLYNPYSQVNVPFYLWNNLDSAEHLPSATLPLAPIRILIRENGGAEVFDSYFLDKMPSEELSIFVQLFLRE